MSPVYKMSNAGGFTSKQRYTSMLAGNSAPAVFEILTIAGGGSGGGTTCCGVWPGGGGAGGVLYTASGVLPYGTTHSVTVGGGAAAPVAGGHPNGNQGSNSVFSSFTAIGGGYGSGIQQAGGAGASITTDIIIDTIPFIGELLSIKDGQTTANITAESAGNVLKNISSVNNMTKMYHALKTGEWISSNGAVLTDGISTPQALFYGLTGTQPQEIPDAFFMNNVANEYKSAGARDEYNGMLKEARTMIKKYLTARDQGDNDSAAVWSQRLTVLFNGTGLTATQKQKMFTQSMQGDTMVEAILRKFIRNGTPEERDARMRTFGEKGTEGN